MNPNHSSNFDFRGNPDRLNSMGSSTLHLAARNGHLHCLVFLTNYGCNVYALNDSIVTPMQEAVNNGRLECVRHIEALVTHQVSQDKTKVEKMQLTANKDAERRIKEKNKLLMKMDRTADKKSKQRKLVNILNSGLGDDVPTMPSKNVMPQQSFSQHTKYPPPSSDIGSTDHDTRMSISDEGSCKRETESDISFGREKSAQTTEKLTDQVMEINDIAAATKPAGDKNIPHPSKSTSLVASLKSLSVNNGFISSGPFTNVSLQGYQGPAAVRLRNGNVMGSHIDDEVPSTSGLQRQEYFRAQTIGNVPPSQRIGEPVGIVDISMGPLYTFLHSLQLDEFRELFLREKIDLRASMLCNENDLREIGLPVGPRKKFLEATSRRRRILRSRYHELIDSAV